jgi:hypothetical protein
MAALPIVVVQPGGQRLGAVPRAQVGPAVGPLAQEGLNEALGLAVGARGVGTGAEVADAGAPTEAREPIRDIAGAIVGQDAPDADPVPSKPRPGAPQELRRRHAPLVAIPWVTSRSRSGRRELSAGAAPPAPAPASSDAQPVSAIATELPGTHRVSAARLITHCRPGSVRRRYRCPPRRRTTRWLYLTIASPGTQG